MALQNTGEISLTYIKNVTIPSYILNNWLDNVVIDDYICTFLGVQKK